jgi:antirestriction protein
METTQTIMPRIYVGTYAKYSRAIDRGFWVWLNFYNSVDELLEGCKRGHIDEAEPEFMAQDFQGFPKYFYSEGMLNRQAELEELYNFLDYCSNNKHNSEAAHEYVDNFQQWDEGYFEERYMGEWDSEADFADHILEETGYYEKMPEEIRGYFDIDRYARDLFLCDFVFCNGHVFNNC